MADLNDNFKIRTFLFTAQVWTPIICPIGCSQVVIQNTDAVNAILIRSDPADATTTKTLPASSELTLRGSSLCYTGPVCAVQALSGVGGTVVVTFIR